MTCFCDVQAGAHLDLAADAERVDALIAGRRRRARAQRLPVIATSCPRLAARAGCPSPPSADELEPAVAVEVARPRCTPSGSAAVERRERAAGRAEQHARARRAGDDQIRGAVVVEIARSAAARARLPALRGGSTRASRSASTSASLGRARDGAIAPSRASTSRSKIASPLASAAAIAHRGPGAGGSVSARNAPPRRFRKTWTAPGVVEERGVGHAFAVEVGPGEAARARDRRRTDRAA